MPALNIVEKLADRIERCKRSSHAKAQRRKGRGKGKPQPLFASSFAPLRHCVSIIRQMIASLLLALLVTLSGTVATYLYDENASFGARLCAGAALGLTALGLVSFVVASFIGLTGIAILFSAAICSSPLAILTDGANAKRLRQDLESVANSTRRLVLRPDAKSIGYFLFYACATIVLCKVFSRAVIQ